MSLRLIVPFTLVALAGCVGAPLTFDEDPIIKDGELWIAFQDVPFNSGPVSVVTAEHGDLRTYALTPCRNGESICGDRVGSLSLIPGYWVIEGAYPDRTFYLSPGGDGVLKIGPASTTLAWEDAGQFPPERPE
ncbi:MAG: hypothetical protein R6V30_03610 [Paracoccaceae bacterium]